MRKLRVFVAIFRNTRCKSKSFNLEF